MDKRKVAYASLIILIVGAAVYGFTYLRIKAVMEGMEIKNIDMIVDPSSNLTSVDVAIVFEMRNPSSYDFEVVIVADLYFENTPLLPMEGQGRLRANDRMVFDIPFNLNSSTYHIFSEAGQFTLVGQITITHKILGFIPVIRRGSV